jgi:two-component system OmpR family sensor kinase
VIPGRAAVARLRPFTLRSRITVGIVVLLAVSCATVGIAAVLTLRSSLVGKLDQQLADAGGRFPASLEHRAAATNTGHHEPDGDEQPDTRSQQPGTFGARLLGGAVTDGAVVRSGADTGVTLTAADRAVLADVPVDGRSHNIALSGLGDYRVLAVNGSDGDVLVTGLPLSGVEYAAHRLAWVEAAVFGVALAVTGVAGALWVSWSLRPLRRVAATAVSVTELPLDSGEVALPAHAPDTDPRTEIGQVGTALNLMLGHVEDALSKRQTSQERLRRFAADASHELRTPVASIRGHAELAQRHPGPVPYEVARALERVVAESSRMSEMVDDLLLLARLDAGRPLERKPVDLTRLVLDGVDDARAVGRDHRWTLDLPEEPVTVPGDEHRLRQVVGNLLANARLHTPAGTKVVASLASGPGSATLTAADDGPGVPEEIRATVFERFTRADRRRPGPGGGAGLGLSIVSGVVAAHGGTVHVESRPGATEFTVVVPRA